jgi:hypothetical protein
MVDDLVIQTEKYQDLFHDLKGDCREYQGLIKIFETVAGGFGDIVNGMV